MYAELHVKIGPFYLQFEDYGLAKENYFRDNLLSISQK